MTIQEAVQQRHSVRQYADTPLTQEQITALQERIGEYNAESGLHIQLVTCEEKAFSGFLARYGKFIGVRTTLLLSGRNRPLSVRRWAIMERSSCLMRRC